MYEELIERMKPKPGFNLKWDKGKDVYSDGDIEDVIIRLIAENEPEDYAKAVYENCSWPVYYHFAPIRRNILEWYPFEKDCSVLEIGCGMGALTGMLCDRCGTVTAVELSKRRATAALLRCREKENLEIIVGNLNDIVFDKKFDYITLIGVLEYQGTYTDSENPYLDFLNKIKTLLKPDGRLLIAIENKCGLKYWCGATEDHTGVPFDGLNQYNITDRKVRTFSKSELEGLVGESGFRNQFFYYPMPDYKLPEVIYSEKRPMEKGDIKDIEPYYLHKETVVIDEPGAYRDMVENGAFEFMANSFLVECSDASDLGRVTYAKMSFMRHEGYRIVTRITNHKKVEKLPVNPVKGREHMEQILRYRMLMESAGLNVLSCESREGELVFPYVDEELLENRLIRAYERKDRQEVFRILDAVYEDILRSSGHRSPDENIMFGLKIAKPESGRDYGPILAIGYLDMIPRNAFYKDEGLLWFDQEWALECVPARFVFWRGIQLLYADYKWLEERISVGEVRERYGLKEEWEEYYELEILFHSTTLDVFERAVHNAIHSKDGLDYTQNIQKLLG